MDGRNEGVMEQDSFVIKIISFADERLLEQADYYAEGERMARETHDHSGSLVDRSGAVTDGVAREYYGDGTLKKTVPFKDGSAHGRSIEYYVTGEVFGEHNYCHGLLHGRSRMYRRDGTLWIDEAYKDGRLHGVSKSYHDNGKPEIRARYRNGNLSGSYARYDRYGCLQERGAFKEGVKDGYYTLYHESGQPARIERYAEGRIVGCEVFDEDGKIVSPGQNRKNSGTGGYIMEERIIYITLADMERLRALIEIYNGNGSFLEGLEQELDRARIVAPEEIPPDVITMNSVVHIRDLDSSEEKTVALVFPEKVGGAEKVVSILAPVGAALIGQKKGDVIEWQVPAGTRRLQVMEIIYQPERVGNYDL